MIYFDENKNAYAFRIEQPLCAVDEKKWAEFALLKLGFDYDVDKTGIVDLRDTEEYKEKQTSQRKAQFEANFLATSLGNYRLQPKGYANAQQSIDTVNNIVMAMDGLNEQIAQMIIFYDTPDFSKEEECTEEWLVEHQHHPEPMTQAEWVEFYIEFTTLYAQKQYQA